MPKPHRVLIDRVSGYADEAAAYLRRRRLTRQPFARTYYPGGRSSGHPPEGEAGRALFDAAKRLIDAVSAEPGTERVKSGRSANRGP
jgi:hypothetical protein